MEDEEEINPLELTSLCEKTSAKKIYEQEVKERNKTHKMKEKEAFQKLSVDIDLTVILVDLVKSFYGFV